MISAIVCVDQNFGIGNNNNLLAHIPEDMKFFRQQTDDSIVIMGRKTYDSLPTKPLPNRTNIVITSNTALESTGDTIFSSMEYIKNWLFNQRNATRDNRDVYVIGGGQIYKELLPYCDCIYLTKVFHSYDNVDTYFPNINKDEWMLGFASEVKEHNGIKYQFLRYYRIKDYKLEG